MSRRLPPLNGLRAFEAAARHLNFSKAAEELNVTPAAVSQQVKSLEAYAGVQLFRRLTRELRLTESGQAALPLVRDGFDLLADGFARMKQAERSGTLTVSVTPSFGAKWLVPKLEGFRAAYPMYDLRIDPSVKLVDFNRDDVDVAIRYGCGNYPGLKVQHLMSECAFPVCSPDYMAGPKGPKTPEDLAKATLLHSVMDHNLESWVPDWSMWLAAMGVKGVDATKGIRFGHSSLMLEAAMEGQGVGLGSSALVERDIAKGHLVCPFPDLEEMNTSFSYWMVYPNERAELPKIKAFNDWMLAEVDVWRKEST